MAVKFENEDTEAMPTRGPHRKSITAAGPSSPEKSKTLGKQEKSKKNIEKFKEMSYKVGVKAERKRRKFKKKQIEYIDWYYPEINESKVREFINQITVSDHTRKDISFFEHIFNTAFMQPSDGSFDVENYLLVKEGFSPVILGGGFPIFMTTAVKSLVLYEAYCKLIKPCPEIDPQGADLDRCLMFRGE